MRLKKIIRFETKEEGIGMYYCDRGSCTDEMQDGMRHPMPYDDDKLCISTRKRGLPYPTSGHWKFGFGSKKQAKAWIYKKRWLRDLHNAGLVVSEYFCHPDECVKGSTQAIFLSSVRHQSFSILEYFNISA